MNHQDERTQDRADRKTVKDTLFSSNLLLHGIAVIAVAVVGWNLSQTYSINATVAQHTVFLSSLKEDSDKTAAKVDTIGNEVDAIYQNQSWKRPNTFQADTTMSYVIDPKNDVSLGDSSK